MTTPSPTPNSLTRRLIDIEPFQQRAWNALCGPATHVLLYGGARSGKTHLVVFWLILRALAKPTATHAVLRFRFNHLKASIIYGTLPEVCETHWPGQKLYDLNKSDWYADFVGGGRVYFGGLDDKERTEKILGQGHSTVYLNEASQISFSARLKAITRLSQSRGLRLKEICDENPPVIGHWTERLWVKGVDPETRRPHAHPERYAVASMNPADSPHIPEETRQILMNLPPRERRRFWEGKFGEGTGQELWTDLTIEKMRVASAPTLSRILVVVDPSGCEGPEDARSDEIGIVVEGLGQGDVMYVLEDASGLLGPSGDEGWGSRLIQLFLKWGADAVAAETNFGGAMVRAVLVAARYRLQDGSYYEGRDVPFHEITASRGKHVRAEPVATLSDNGRVKLVGPGFPDLEDQLRKFTTVGYVGDRSPDRADAMIHGGYALGIARMPGQGMIDWMAQQVEASRAPAVTASGVRLTPGSLVSLRPPPHIQACGIVQTMAGKSYSIESGVVRVEPEDVDGLRAIGFTSI